MPHFTLSFGPGGPVMDVVVSVSQPRRHALEKAGNSVPSPIQIRALIDTGASCTCIDPSVLDSLGITPTGKVPVHTPSTNSQAPHEANQYDVGLTIPTAKLLLFKPNVPVLGAALEHQGIKALIGRDVLEDCLFVYIGQSNIFSLAF